MNYFEHNDEKGRDARIRTAINRAERARMAQPFDGTLYMSKYDLRARRAEGTCAAYGVARDAAETARVMRANDAYAANHYA